MAVFRRNIWRLTTAITFTVFVALPAKAVAQDPADICDVVAQNAAAATGVPISVLKAISLTETGRKRGGKMRPWPWTVNMEGKGLWFDNPQQALDYVAAHHARGARSYDVGCFQLNYKWHGQNFASIEAMFQPDTNALYAARFLLDLYREKGNWKDAAGAYHSRTKKYADKYKARFTRFRSAFLAEDNQPISTVQNFAVASAPVATAKPRVNAFPLLQQGDGRRGLGSLVPVTSGGPGLFGQSGS